MALKRLQGVFKYVVNFKESSLCLSTRWFIMELY